MSLLMKLFSFSKKPIGKSSVQIQSGEGIRTDGGWTSEGEVEGEDGVEG